MSMMVIASAAMTNLRRIHGYQEKLREELRKAGAVQKQMEEAIKDASVSFWRLHQRGFPAQSTMKLAAARLQI